MTTTAPTANGNASPAPATAQRQAGRFGAAKVSTSPVRLPNKTIVTGRSGIGKTFLISTVPNVFVIPIEDGLRGASPDHHPAYFADERERPILPRSLAELYQALDVFARDINAPVDGKRPHRHLAIDGLTGIEALVHAEVTTAEKVAHMEAKEYRKLWHAAEPHMLAVQRKLDAVRATGVHLWIVAHSAEVIDASSTTGEVYRKWDLLLKGSGDIGVQARNIWRSWADNVFFIDWETEVRKGDKTRRSIGRHRARVLYTRETATHYAKSRDRLPESMPAEWEDLAKAMAAGASSTEPKLRAEIANILGSLSVEDRASIEANVAAASGPNRLAAILSRAQGMLAIAQQDAPEEMPEEAAAPAAE